MSATPGSKPNLARDCALSWKAANKGVDPMPWEEERNIRSLSPHGRKEMQGHGARAMHDATNSVGCPEMPDGITGAPMRPDPHGSGFKMPVHATPSAARPKNEPAQTTVPHTMGPHDHLHPAPHELASKARR
jgi:hypothetical protein